MFIQHRVIFDHVNKFLKLFKWVCQWWQTPYNSNTRTWTIPNKWCSQILSGPQPSVWWSASKATFLFLKDITQKQTNFVNYFPSHNFRIERQNFVSGLQGHFKKSNQQAGTHNCQITAKQEITVLHIKLSYVIFFTVLHYSVQLFNHIVTQTHVTSAGFCHWWVCCLHHCLCKVQV